MCNSELKKMLKTNNSGSIIEVELDGKKLNCVVKEVQKNNLQEILNLDLQGSVEEIPEHIELNVSDLHFGDKIFVKVIVIPEGIIVLTDPKTLLAVVNGNKSESLIT